MIRVKRAKLVILAVSILAAPRSGAQVSGPEENTATMSDRERQGLRGPVKSCTEENTFPGATDAEGKTYPEVRSESTTEYDTDGRILLTRFGNSDGSQWVTRYSYDASGRLRKTASGMEGTALTDTTYSYDRQGRLRNVSDADRPDSPATFSYDDHGRKSGIQIFRPADYRPNTVAAGSPFEAVGMVPNLPDGGSVTTIYDEHDRPTEVQVRDTNDELVNRAVRTYDAQGHVLEEKQILDNPELMFPPEARARMLDESGLSPDDLRQELHTQITKFMADQSGPYSVSYSYDTHDRLSHTSRRIFNSVDEIETTYNERGDTESEITRSSRLGGQTDPAIPAAGPPPFSEVRYSYKYDHRNNWIEKSISSRSAPDAAFESSTAVKRTVTYY
jgi:YD repeat-containing protein